jgi:hypothetical protein
MSDDDKELEDREASLNPDLLEDGLGEEEFVDEEEDKERGIVSLENEADKEYEEGLLEDSYDDDEKDLW